MRNMSAEIGVNICMLSYGQHSFNSSSSIKDEALDIESPTAWIREVSVLLIGKMVDMSLVLQIRFVMNKNW